MSETLLMELKMFVEELERKERSAVYRVPDEAVKNVKRAKSLEPLLHDMFMQAIGPGGIRLEPILRREFGIDAALTDRIDQWAPYDKERMADALHDAVDRADIRAGNQGVFFKGTPSREEAQDALRMLRTIAHAAVAIRFAERSAGPEPYVEMLDGALRFYELPNTFPEGTPADYRSLLSERRLASMSGSDDVTNALKAFARAWYQRSSFTFLENPDDYFSYEEVEPLLYALTEEQTERLRARYTERVRELFETARRKKDLDRARKLTTMLETVIGWHPRPIR
ncbi:hypothetical protein FE782_07510 [Paenibacillus antri]|uniref:Uncharacterized protein n=1 Tax=Paenibacillus antri TaxID=2582848 RepID=A0A5R9GGB8_9BACL|nr:hypothetical protein [Paenibacillus antri]TLS53200.1 hypothetical protein FE782_07510 [Paenibacillus antri]